MSREKRSLFLRFIIGFVILTGLDQWTKGLVTTYLKGNPPIPVLEGVFEFYYSENRGAAFGMLQEQQVFFALIAMIVLGAIGYMLIRMPDDRKYRPLTVCLLLIGAGAVGNMIDRLSQSYVVDFLYFKLINFPIFNVADCYVTIGAFCLVLLVMLYYKDEDMACFSLKKKKED
ncbi:signal peptidase II [Lacrimispora sp. 210928-DFI.3.58]|uniref:signal peptidase II n=1 Tax=Lacrimispora sp. 210928-DFI.3.58 TaxID=2883214 RepID=UPI0015B3940C|nr:signal peptidase II [Lacrimispora sp. 210928-DFI.3.58]MCB7319078.1 signal peptidase II [Lacrimispora sp. 210928-DFI.3.58]